MHSRLPLAFLVVVALLGPACGGDGGREPVAVLASASTNTVDAKSSRVALTVDIDDKTAAGGKRTLTGEGAFEFTTGHGTLAMDTAALGLPGLSGKIEVISLGQVFYVQVPSGLLPGKPWLKMDLATLGQTAGVDLAGLQQLGANDPSANLRFVEGAQDAEQVGEAKVRGVDTTQYHFTVDLEKTKAKVPEDLHDDIDRLIDQLGSSTYPADAWVDGDDQIRRLRVSISGSGDVGDSVVTQEFYDFGVKVDAVAPPADQVSDFAELLQSAGQG
ncbi:MAG: hypothetical protein QOG87_3319 [Actinomycetota bacterium]|jgi:hypothetical protein